MAGWEGGLEHPGDIASGRITVSRDIPTAILCQHHTHCGPAPTASPCSVVGAARLPQGRWAAVFGLWMPFGKSRRGLKALGMRRGTRLAFVGEQTFEGLSPYPSAP